MNWIRLSYGSKSLLLRSIDRHPHFYHVLIGKECMSCPLAWGSAILLALASVTWIDILKADVWNVLYGLLAFMWFCHHHDKNIPQLVYWSRRWETLGTHLDLPAAWTRDQPSQSEISQCPGDLQTCKQEWMIVGFLFFT